MSNYQMARTGAQDIPGWSVSRNATHNQDAQVLCGRMIIPLDTANCGQRAGLLELTPRQVVYRTASSQEVKLDNLRRPVLHSKHNPSRTLIRPLPKIRSFVALGPPTALLESSNPLHTHTLSLSLTHTPTLTYALCRLTHSFAHSRSRSHSCSLALSLTHCIAAPRGGACTQVGRLARGAAHTAADTATFTKDQMPCYAMMSSVRQANSRVETPRPCRGCRPSLSNAAGSQQTPHPARPRHPCALLGS